MADLTQYEKKTGQSDGEVADRCGTVQSTINRLRRRRMKASMELALRIERGTEGEVTAEELPLAADTRKEIAALRAQIRAPASGEAA